MATIKQIAEKTGFSQSTVSIVLGNRGKERKISDRTQNIIFQAARELGYQPSMAARLLRSGETQESIQIALFWAQDFRAPMMVRFLRGLQEEIEHQKEKIHLSVIPYRTDMLREEKMLCSRAGCHGAIICNASEKDLRFLEETELPLPIVLYNRESSRYATVRMDNRKIGVIAAETFAAAGVQTVVPVCSVSGFPGADVRDQAFFEKAQELGLQVLPKILAESSRNGGYQAVKDLPEPPAEGFFCGSDALALGILRAFSEKKIACPEKAKVLAIGNGNPEDAAFAIPSLSVISLPMEAMAGECLNMLIRQITSGSSEPESVEFPVKLICRESTGQM